MTAFPKILVVDDGARTSDHALSADLAELGYASVTTSIEAAEDVLAVIPPPAAILLQPPRGNGSPERDLFLAAAERFRSRGGKAGVPVIVLDGPLPSAPGTVLSALGEWTGTRVLNQPDR